MYVLVTHSDRYIASVHKRNVIIHKGDDEWSDVQKWADRLLPSLDLDGRFPASAFLVFDKETLTEFCRANGIMLHASTDNISIGASEEVGGRVWLSLDRAVAEEKTGHPDFGDINRSPSGIWTTNDVHNTFRPVFENNSELDGLHCVSSRQVNRAFVYVDVSGFSKYSPGQQALVINSLVGLVNHREFWNSEAAEARQNKEAELCIGDGYIFVFPDPLKAALFASWLGELIQQLVARRGRERNLGSLAVKFHFRIGVHYGPVYRFWDPGRNGWNYIGDGINGGNRVLSVIDKKFDDVILVSDSVERELIARSPLPGSYGSIRSCLESRGRQEDKHGREWRVFLLNHTKLCEDDVLFVLTGRA